MKLFSIVFVNHSATDGLLPRLGPILQTTLGIMQAGSNGKAADGGGGSFAGLRTRSRG